MNVWYMVSCLYVLFIHLTAYKNEFSNYSKVQEGAGPIKKFSVEYRLRIFNNK